MSTQQKWATVEVPSHGPMYRIVVNENGLTVCPPMMRSDAEQIVREHNSHDALAWALRLRRVWDSADQDDPLFIQLIEQAQEQSDSDPRAWVESYLDDLADTALTAAGVN